MAKGFKVIAIIKNDSAIEITDSNYKIITTNGGTRCIVEKNSKEYYPIESEEQNED